MRYGNSKYTIRYDNGRFVLDNKLGDTGNIYNSDRTLEIIGNIYENENPDLLKTNS